MGTRGLYGFVVSGEVKAVYNHYDSYPSELGKNLVREILDLGIDTEEGYQKINTQAIALVDVSNRKPNADDVERWKDYTDLSVSEQSKEDWYCLMHNAQGRVTPMLTIGQCEDYEDFAKSSLFCEWGYLINLDDKVFEVYQGYQKEPHTEGRFASKRSRDGYYPIKLIKKIPFDELSTYDVSELEDRG